MINKINQLKNIKNINKNQNKLQRKNINKVILNQVNQILVNQHAIFLKLKNNYVLKRNKRNNKQKNA